MFLFLVVFSNFIFFIVSFQLQSINLRVFTWKDSPLAFSTSSWLSCCFVVALFTFCWLLVFSAHFAIFVCFLFCFKLLFVPQMHRFVIFIAFAGFPFHASFIRRTFMLLVHSIIRPASAPLHALLNRIRLWVNAYVCGHTYIHVYCTCIHMLFYVPYEMHIRDYSSWICWP